MVVGDRMNDVCFVQIGKLPQTSDARRVRPCARAQVNVTFGPLLQHFVERHASFESRERGGKTRVTAVAEAQVAFALAECDRSRSRREPQEEALRATEEEGVDLLHARSHLPVLAVHRQTCPFGVSANMTWRRAARI